MEKIQLKTESRDTNTRTAKPLYKAGLIPAELYGKHLQNLHLSLNQIEFEKAFRKAGESTIVELSLPNGEVRNVLIQDVELHYLSNLPIHVDFYEVNMTEKVTATVAIEFFGESHAVKAMGGTLVRALNEVEVESLPGDLPHQFDVDISKLDTFEKQILVKDLIVSDKVEIKADPEEMVATVQPPRVMEEITPVDEAAAVAAAVGDDSATSEGEDDNKEDKKE